MLSDENSISVYLGSEMNGAGGNHLGHSGFGDWADLKTQTFRCLASNGVEVYLFLGEMPDMRLKEPFENVSIREATAQVITNETLGTCRS